LASISFYLGDPVSHHAHLSFLRYEIAPENPQIELHEIGHRRVRSAPTTPQLPLSTNVVDDSAPASGTPGTRTSESTSDTPLSWANGRSARKHVRNSLATLTEWMPPSLHSRFGSRASSPRRQASNDGDASDPFDAIKEHGKAYRRGRKKRRRKAEIFVSWSKSSHIQFTDRFSLPSFFVLRAPCCGRLFPTPDHEARGRNYAETGVFAQTGSSPHDVSIENVSDHILASLTKLVGVYVRFAAPTHRLQAQIQATARVLDLEVSTLYLPNVMLISFGDAGTSTSNLKFIQQGSSLDLGKLLDAHRLYWKVRTQAFLTWYMFNATRHRSSMTRFRFLPHQHRLTI
jgi:Putative threonine/serine exporter